MTLTLADTNPTPSIAAAARANLISMIDCWATHGKALSAGTMAAAGVAALATFATGELLEPSMIAEDLKRLAGAFASTGFSVGTSGIFTSWLADKLIDRLAVQDNSRNSSSLQAKGLQQSSSTVDRAQQSDDIRTLMARYSPLAGLSDSQAGKQTKAMASDGFSVVNSASHNLQDSTVNCDLDFCSPTNI